MAPVIVRWRAWLMVGAGVAAIGAGMMLGHAVFLAVGLGLAGLSGIGTAGRGREGGRYSPELGVSTNSQAPTIPGGWKQTIFGRTRRGGHPIMDVPSVVEPDGAWLGQLTTRGGQRVAVRDTGLRRRLLVCGPGERVRVPTWAVELDTDEAERVAAWLRVREPRGVSVEVKRPVAAMSEELR